MRVSRFREFWARYRRSCLAGLLCTLIIGALSLTQTAEILELRTHDFRFQLRKARRTKTKIVLAIIGNNTLKEWTEPIVGWGARYGQMILQAKANGANCIGFDVIPAFDLDKYLEGVGATKNSKPIDSFMDGIDAWEGRVILSNFDEVGLVRRILDANGLNGNVGYAIAGEQIDESIRQSDLFQDRVKGKTNSSFSAILAARYLGIKPTRENLLLLLKGAGEGSEKNKFWINYTDTNLPENEFSFPVIKAERLASGRLDAAEKLALKDAIILVGVGFYGSNDIYPTIGGKKTLGLDINAQIIATLADGAVLRRLSRWNEFALTISLGLATLIFSMPLRVTRGAFLIVLVGLAWFGLSFYLFKFQNFLLPVASPLISLLVPFAVYHSVRSLQEAIHRAEIEAEFGRRVSPAVRDFLLSNPSHRELGGKRYDGVILFLDIRGFTTYSQTREASEVVSELNKLFEVIVPVISAKGGLINKFTGDGLLAMFGVPNPLPNPAQSALDAALEILRKSSAIRRGDGGAWHLGCSIHLGSLIGGNVGEKERQEFTVIGDTVNIAARLEELNKHFKSEVVVSKNTYEMLDTRPDFEGPFLAEIRGRNSIEVYTGSNLSSKEKTNVTL